MKKFHTHLLEARKTAGFSNQEECAKALGIPQQTYGNYESGRSFPKEDVLRKIGVVLGVSIDSLLELGEKPPTPKQENTINEKIKTLKKDASEASESIKCLLSSIQKLEGVL